MNNKILVVDDDVDIRDMVALLLNKKDYSADAAIDGNQALEMCKLNTYDLILLDIMMPNLDGYSFCQEIRKNNARCYIIFVSALDGIDALEKALMLGGDDFIRKPFETRELLSRIAVGLRRLNSTRNTVLSPTNSILSTCNLKVFPNNNMVEILGQEIHFTPIEMSLFSLLISNPKKQFTYKELYESVWETEYINDKGTVATFISSIKKKLKGSGIENNIVTVWGKGYFFKNKEA